MKKSTSTSSSISLTYLKYFALVVLVLIVGALIFRVIRLAQQASFTNHYFSVLFQGENPFLLHINTDKKQIASISFPAELANTLQKPEEATYKLMVPVNAIVRFRSMGESSQYTYKSFFSFGSFVSHVSKAGKYEYKKSNQFDIGKVYMLGKYSTLKSEHLDVNKLFENEKTSPKYEEFLQEVLRDNKVLNEKVPVEVINASGLNGVGSAVAEILSLNGFNVVSISSTRTPIAGSTITIRIPENATTARIQDIFSVPVATNTESHVADISIVIGEEYARKKLRVE